MNNHLVEYLSQFVNLTQEEIDYIESNSMVKEYKKGDILLREGQIAKNTFLILKGCVKSFYLEDGEEYITDFFVQKNLIIPAGYAQQKQSGYFLSCLDDSIISTGTIERTSAFLQRFPRLAQICLQISNDLIAKQQVSFDEYKMLSPEVRV